jgi:hypothetical protein
VEFWGEFDEVFGGVGRDPISYYSYEIGYILHLGPEQMTELTPADLMGAMALFNVLHRDA